MNASHGARHIQPAPAQRLTRQQGLLWNTVDRHRDDGPHTEAFVLSTQSSSGIAATLLPWCPQLIVPATHPVVILPATHTGTHLMGLSHHDNDREPILERTLRDCVIMTMMICTWLLPLMCSTDLQYCSYSNHTQLMHPHPIAWLVCRDST